MLIIYREFQLFFFNQVHHLLGRVTLTGGVSEIFTENNAKLKSTLTTSSDQTIQLNPAQNVLKTIIFLL